MHPQVYFWIIFLALSFLVIYLDRQFSMLRDISKARPQPYSWSRVQLAWWTIIVLAAFISILIKYHQAPELNQSTVILLGISAATIATARIIDVSEINDPAIIRHQDDNASNFFLDILSDQNGVSMYRFQTVVFNFVFGAWFISTVLHNLVSDPCSIYQSLDPKVINPLLETCNVAKLNFIMPVITPNNLILLGLSSATYAALKTTENKTGPQGSANRRTVPDTKLTDLATEEPAFG